MPSAANLRLQIETALADRIPSALTPPPRVIRPTAPTGIPALDDALGGGFPVGAITELAGPECSGRTSLALSFVAGLTQAARVCAWIDVSDTLHPESAAAIGVDLNRLLWIRCGPEPQQLTFPGFENQGSQPSRVPHICPVLADVGMRAAHHDFAVSQGCSSSKISAPPIRHDYLAPRCSEPTPKVRQHPREVVHLSPPVRHASDKPPDLQPVTCNLSPATVATKRPLVVRKDPDPLNSKFQTLNSRRKPWTRLDQALRATDLLLQAGGFSAIVLDMGSVAPEFALRVPLATWFRYRAAAERTHASVLLLTQHACTKSSAGLVLHCLPSSVDPDSGSGSTTVFTGTEHCVEIARERFALATKVVDFDRRKPPQSDHSILWQSRTPWSSEVGLDTHPIPHAKSGRK
jgi:recombination protein RecA